jgi:hypothetical protein
MYLVYFGLGNFCFLFDFGAATAVKHPLDQKIILK